MCFNVFKVKRFQAIGFKHQPAHPYTEVLTWILCSHDDNFDNVKRHDDGAAAAIVANPSCKDVEVARSSLLGNAVNEQMHA